jgi:uncharacterized membrane protein
MTKIDVRGPHDMKKKAPPKSTNHPAKKRKEGELDFLRCEIVWKSKRDDGTMGSERK